MKEKGIIISVGMLVIMAIVVVSLSKDIANDMAQNPAMALSATVLVLLLLAVSIGIYFIPSFIAGRRGHHQLLPIFLLNLFLGWSLLGWVAALVWATVALPERAIT